MKLEPQFKFLIPLETEGLKKEFFTEEAGFIGAYSDVTGEIENVSPVDCFYLLFDYFLDTKEKQKRYWEMEKIERASGPAKYKHLYEDPKHIIVDGKHCLLYRYPIMSTAAIAVRYKLSLNTPYIRTGCKKILKFWGIDDEDAWKLTESDKNYQNLKYSYKPLKDTKRPKNQLAELNKIFSQQ